MVKINKETGELIIISGIIGAIASMVMNFFLTIPMDFQLTTEELLFYSGRFVIGIIMALVVSLFVLFAVRRINIIDTKEWNKK